MICLAPIGAWAEVGSLLDGGTLAQGRGSLFQPRATQQAPQNGASLFAGQSGGSFFAPIQRQSAPVSGVMPLNFAGSAVHRLRHIIGQAESPRAGYDAVQHGARIKPAKLPTQMTIGEIYDWIDATPGQPHAIGRYQFIPDTLRRVVRQVGADRRDRFTPALQDRLADVLLADAGFPDFMAGRLSQERFINNLAAIWAGLPTSNGRSKYHGFAGNRATVTLAYFQSEIAKIRPG
ncbi:hypothetical protein [Yoonia sp. SS1-5]|uniref:Glycoside hydrolase family 104 protein n=1 Tax=Yoonia rhodophyticola TaxID=3137370 RepID=A0AAN0NLB3_9RHOB